jgi:hypothetical protein
MVALLAAAATYIVVPKQTQNVIRDTEYVYGGGAYIHSESDLRKLVVSCHSDKAQAGAYKLPMTYLGPMPLDVPICYLQWCGSDPVMPSYPPGEEKPWGYSGSVPQLANCTLRQSRETLPRCDGDRMHQPIAEQDRHPWTLGMAHPETANCYLR